MKKLLPLIALLLINHSLFAQIPSQASQYVFCNIVCARPPQLLSNKITISVDFGQHSKILEDTRMRDPQTGELFIFNSVVDALNFMSADGWELVQVYVEVGENTSCTHYLMKKPVEALEPGEADEFY